MPVTSQLGVAGCLAHVLAFEWDSNWNQAVSLVGPFFTITGTKQGRESACCWQHCAKLLHRVPLASCNVISSSAACPGASIAHTVAVVAHHPCKKCLTSTAWPGAAACDRRRDIKHATEAFPGMDFSHIEPGVDLIYQKHRVETEPAVMERGLRFLQWLMARCAPAC